MDFKDVGDIILARDVHHDNIHNDGPMNTKGFDSNPSTTRTSKEHFPAPGLSSLTQQPIINLAVTASDAFSKAATSVLQEQSTLPAEAVLGAPQPTATSASWAAAPLVDRPSMGGTTPSFGRSSMEAPPPHVAPMHLAMQMHAQDIANSLAPLASEHIHGLKGLIPPSGIGAVDMHHMLEGHPLLPDPSHEGEEGGAELQSHPVM